MTDIQVANVEQHPNGRLVFSVRVQASGVQLLWVINGYLMMLASLILVGGSLGDRLGRKKLLLVGAVGTAACLAGVAAIFMTGHYEFLLVWLLVGYIAFFAFSQGAVIWVYLSEVFPNRVRAKGQSLGSFTHWIMNAMISMIFPMLAAQSGASISVPPLP